MRTTVDVNDVLLRQAKRRAAEDGITLRTLIEEALRLRLAGAAPGRRTYRLQWKTERGQLNPGVTLDDRDALFDLLDGRR